MTDKDKNKDEEEKESSSIATTKPTTALTKSKADSFPVLLSTMGRENLKDDMDRLSNDDIKDMMQMAKPEGEIKEKEVVSSGYGLNNTVTTRIKTRKWYQ